jgi:D-alanyl-D-alanine carboxypeptidase
VLIATLAATITAAMQSTVKAGLAPSISVAVVRSGRLTYSNAVGFSDVASHTRATPLTLYRIGSITKLFTAVSVMQLVQEHKISLDEHLARFEPGFPNANEITIAEMLMHRSGIPNYLDQSISDGDVFRPTTPQAIVASVAKLQPLSKPGTSYSYSNTNYVLLGLIVESVSGMSLPAYYTTHIFRPAGMYDTYVGSAPKGAALAIGYAANSHSTEDPGNPTWYFGCGDILSTAQDLARFDIALMHDRLLSRSTLKAMIAGAMPTGEGHIGYGYGVMTFPFGSTMLEGHHGGMPGFESDDEMILRDDFAVVALGNSFGFPTRAILNSALSYAYPVDFARLVAETTPAPVPTEDPQLTTRFTEFLAAITSGKMPSGLDTAMATAFTPAAVNQLQQFYSTYGAFQSLQYVGQDSVQTYRRYHYTAVFAKGKLPVMFVLDAHGSIAGFFNESQ